MKPKHKRLYLYSTLLIIFFAGCALLFINLRDNLVYFYSPTDIYEGKNKESKIIRVGGMVLDGSIERKIIFKNGKELENINFQITDFSNSIDINFIGILPDLFKEGQGVIVEGKFNDERFFASKVLAKHDENYMPPEIKDLVESKVNKNDN